MGSCVRSNEILGSDSDDSLRPSRPSRLALYEIRTCGQPDRSSQCSKPAEARTSQQPLPRGQPIDPSHHRDPRSKSRHGHGCAAWAGPRSSETGSAVSIPWATARHCRRSRRRSERPQPVTTKRQVLSILTVERNGVEFHESGPSGLLIEVFCGRGALFGAPRHVVFGCARTEAPIVRCR
ncbi:hypothetical protein AGR8A_pAt20145 [Agrobacterium fabrum str. J-07]|nr:hypothetical protein AGR8A_pAt20145 [Agrobacterium fabrum str. J-07]